MAETKPFKSGWHWHSVRDRHNPRLGLDKANKVTCFTFVQYFCGPRYNFTQVLKILSLLLLIGTCIFNLKLVIETNRRLENHRLILELDSDSDVVPIDEDDYFSHLRANNDAEEISDKFSIQVISSKDLVEVIVNGRSVHRDAEANQGRGIHVVVLHETTGSVMSQRVFDTYAPKQDEALVVFLNSIISNRIFVFAIKDEASFELGKSAREKLNELGSKMIDDLSWRSNWAMICSKRGTNFAENLETTEDITAWATDVVIATDIDSIESQVITCDWPQSDPFTTRRAHFCSHFDGYLELCTCNNPSPLTFGTKEVLPASSVPVAIIASNRPQYLYRMLRSLLSARGVNPDVIIVFIDGHFEEPYEIARLFNIRVIQHVPVGVKNARISQHYKSSLSAMFTLFPQAEEIIILEEDLDVSPDFFSYFSQTMHLLNEDTSLYCISAWNDQAYDHSSTDPSLLYRVETMPGLGWMLKRSLFVEELEPYWPSQEKRWDWDMWMRSDTMRKGRECGVPDVPRTFHFGSVGINMNSYFFEMYFEKHALNKRENVRLKDVDTIKKAPYERLMHTLVRDSKLLDHSKSPCDDNFITEELSLNNTYVAYFRMDKEGSTDVFIEVLRCLKLWDLEARGLHRGAFRTFIKKRHVIFVGYPASTYSLYKPTDVNPIFIESIEKNEGEIVN
ncbi:protein O-linked-mannose beta-1,2-N-acetylglucosaminyltransferase 1-like [Styela clava]